MYVTSLAGMETLCSLPFCLPSTRGSPGVMNLRGSLRYHYVWTCLKQIIFKSNQILHKVLTSINYQSHFMQVFIIFASQLSFNHFVLKTYNHIHLLDLPICLYKMLRGVMSLGSVARSKGVCPLQIKSYHHMHCSYQYVYMRYSGHVLLALPDPKVFAHCKLTTTLTFFHLLKLRGS